MANEMREVTLEEMKAAVIAHHPHAIQNPNGLIWRTDDSSSTEEFIDMECGPLGENWSEAYAKLPSTPIQPEPEKLSTFLEKMKPMPTGGKDSVSAVRAMRDEEPEPTALPVSGEASEQPDAVLVKIEKALQMVFDLCKPKGIKGERRWIMSIPAQPDYDPDIVIADALYAARRKLIAALPDSKPTKEKQ